MIEMMQAALFEGVGKPLRIGEIAKPAPGNGDLLIAVTACGVCGTDVHIAREGTISTAFTPIVLGHESAGVIVEVGAGITGWQLGDRVALYPHIYCGECPSCLAKREGLCYQSQIFGLHIHGAMAQFLAVPERCAIRLPDNIPLETAAILTDAGATSYHAVFRRGQVSAGQNVAIFGCGGLGSLAIRYCSLAGAERIIAVDTNSVARERALEIGATDTVDPGSGEVHKQVRELTGKAGGVDVAFEFIGLARTVEQAVRSLRRGGRAVAVGIGVEKIQLSAIRTFVGNEYELVGSMGLDLQDLKDVLQLVADDRINLSGAATCVPLTEINNVLDDLEHGRGTGRRYVVQPTKDYGVVR